MIDINDYFTESFSIQVLDSLASNIITKNTAQGIDNINFDSFNKRKDEHLKIIENKVLKNNYNFSNYREKLILKSRNSNPRLISIPTIRDRIVLKTLHNILKKIYPEIHQKLPQVYISKLTEALENYDYYIKIDISNFYGAISHGILMELLKQRIKHPTILRLISQAITNPTIGSGQKSDKIKKELIGVPQGISISNFLASLYMLDLDIKYQNKHNFFYARYVDDIIILCHKKDAKTIYSDLIYHLEGQLNLKINKDKTTLGYLTDAKFDFLGYKFSKSKNSKPLVSVKEQSKKKFERSIIDIFHAYENNKNMLEEEFIFRLNNKITGSFSQVLHPSGDNTLKKYGWLFYFSQINDFKLLYHFDAFVRNLCSKYSKCCDIDPSKIKSFVKSYYEIKYNVQNTDYIHNPDALNINEKRQLLLDTFNIKSAHSIPDDYVNALYYQRVYRPLKKEYQDIQKLIS